MKKRNVAILFGGCSEEYAISLHSAAGVIRALDPERNTLIPIGINRQGDWFLTTADPQRIETDHWHSKQDRRLQLVLSRSGFQLKDQQGNPIEVDVFFPVLHGRNGEDGTLQGMMDLFAIPYVGCGMSASLIAMDKVLSHQLASAAGIAVSQMVVVDRNDPDRSKKEIRQLQLPCFVKPVRGGSSIGITRIESWDKLEQALQLALSLDERALVEEAVPGQEIGCSIVEKNGQLILGAVDRIQLNSDFFDYQEKYVDSHAQVECPAILPPALIDQIHDTARTLWAVHQCRSLARIDLFLTPDNKIVFNEINTLPGLTATSRFPRMMERAGMDFSCLLQTLIDQAAKGEHHE